MRFILLCTAFSLFSVLNVHSQGLLPSIENRVYPAGVIPGIRADIYLQDDTYLLMGMGYNITDRGDWGKHDDEQGAGPGISAGLIQRNVFMDGLDFSLRTDLWFLTIDWRDFVPTGPSEDFLIEEGSTDVAVLQPTLAAEYRLPLGKKFIVRPTIQLGYEWNIHTDGEDVGSGPILLSGINFAYRLD